MCERERWTRCTAICAGVAADSTSDANGDLGCAELGDGLRNTECLAQCPCDDLCTKGGLLSKGMRFLTALLRDGVSSVVGYLGRRLGDEAYQSGRERKGKAPELQTTQPCYIQANPRD